MAQSTKVNKAAMRDRECEALRNANKELLDQVGELKERYTRAVDELERRRAGSRKIADDAADAERKSDSLEIDNAVLRRVILEQATVYASTLKALLLQ